MCGLTVSFGAFCCAIFIQQMRSSKNAVVKSNFAVRMFILCPGCQSQTCFYHLRRLRSVSQQLGRDVTAKLVSAFVLSRLDCCNAVLTGLPASTLAPLQRVLSAAARVVVGLGPRDHVTPSLCELHWLPIAARIDYKLCLLIAYTSRLLAKYLITLPNVDTWASNPSWSSLRSSSNSNLIVRRARRKIGDRAFAVVAPRVWNRLPTELKTM